MIRGRRDYPPVTNVGDDAATMAKHGRFRGKCKCGQKIIFRQGPWGYKEICPECGAAVRLRPPRETSPTGMVLNPTDSTIIIKCTHCKNKYAATFRQMGRHLACPDCGHGNAVPMPGRETGEIQALDVEEMEPEVPGELDPGQEG